MIAILVAWRMRKEGRKVPKKWNESEKRRKFDDNLCINEIKHRKDSLE